jgi:hypothetical protein
MKIEISEKELNSLIEALSLASMYLEDSYGQLHQEEIKEYDTLRNKISNMAVE